MHIHDAIHFFLCSPDTQLQCLHYSQDRKCNKHPVSHFLTHMRNFASNYSPIYVQRFNQPSKRLLLLLAQTKTTAKHFCAYTKILLKHLLHSVLIKLASNTQYIMIDIRHFHATHTSTFNGALQIAIFHIGATGSQ